MNDKKSTSISGEHKLNLTLSGMTNDELIEKGRKKWEPTPIPTPLPQSAILETSKTTRTVKAAYEMQNASASLVNASESIVDGVLVVIGALEEQNGYQKTTNSHLSKIGSDLVTIHIELIKTRNENRSVRKIMLAVLIGMILTIGISIYAIEENNDQMDAGIKRSEKLQEQLQEAIEAAKKAKEITTAAAQLSQNRSEVVIRPSKDNPNEAFVEISQPVKNQTAGSTTIVERDVVHIPMKMMDAKVRPPLTTIMDDSLKQPTVIVHDD